MKATELRIGNYVNYIFKTLSIDAPEYKIKNGADIQLHQSNNLYKPIPLTEQWLKDFGFIKNFVENDEGRYDDYEFNEFHIHGLGDDIFIFLTRRIKYVHRLQNLYFALTGEELIK